MTLSIPTNFQSLWSENRDLQSKAFSDALAATDRPVDWAYEVWDEVLKNLKHEDNHNRAIAAQVLCNLAKSDPKNRMLKDFDRLFAVTRDDRFVTARHCMQALWKVGAAGAKQRKLLVDSLQGRYRDCIAHKNCTLIRYDIIVSLRKLYDASNDESIKAKALQLIETEADLKYRKKYVTLWKPGA
jgi:hypothetical protein